MPPNRDRRRSAGLRSLPSVDRLLQQPALAGSGLPRSLLVAALRATLADERARLDDANTSADISTLAANALERVRRQLSASLRPVINATGVILHTNLGRAPVSDEAAAAMASVAARYSNLEIDLATG